MFSLAEIESVIPLVRANVPPTPQYAWPLLKAQSGVEVIIKHENHTPIGAFKVRGGLVYLQRAKQARPQLAGVISATRGNHGQSLAYAGMRAGVAVSIVVPRGNSSEKNAAMRALGAELIEHGRDFDESSEQALKLAAERGLEFAPSFHRDLVLGVATYAHELLSSVDDLDTIYAPIGLGSGICGLIGMRNALGLRTKIVGVVAARANAYRLSLAAGRVITTDAALTFADGMAVRVPHADAFEMIRQGVERIVEVSEQEIAAAIRMLFSATHNCAEGAGAAPYAALMQERERLQGRRVAVVLSGQNIDRPVLASVLNGETPCLE
jgi:threonine dehydratase